MFFDIIREIAIQIVKQSFWRKRPGLKLMRIFLVKENIQERHYHRQRKHREDDRKNIEKDIKDDFTLIIPDMPD